MDMQSLYYCHRTAQPRHFSLWLLGPGFRRHQLLRLKSQTIVYVVASSCRGRLPTTLIARTERFWGSSHPKLHHLEPRCVLAQNACWSAVKGMYRDPLC